MRTSEDALRRKFSCTLLHSAPFRYHREKETEEGARRWTNQPHRRH